MAHWIRVERTQDGQIIINLHPRLEPRTRHVLLAMMEHNINNVDQWIIFDWDPLTGEIVYDEEALKVLQLRTETSLKKI